MSDAERLVELARACEHGTPVFVLVDPLAGEPFSIDSGGVSASREEATRARVAAWGRDVVPVELPASIDLAPHLHPYLVALQGPDDPWLAGSFAIAEAERIEAGVEGLAGEGIAVMRMGGWLHSSAHGEQIAQALSDSLRVRCEAMVKPRYQRLVDRRTLGWARCVASEARVSATLGPIQRWTYLDAAGAVNHIHRSDEQRAPLRWSAEEWKTFMQGNLVHQTLARYLGELTQQGPHALPGERELLMRAHRALMQAAAARAKWPSLFKNPHDDTAWAALLLLHGDVSSSPVVARALAASSADEPETTLHELVSSLNNALAPAGNAMS